MSLLLGVLHDTAAEMREYRRVVFMKDGDEHAQKLLQKKLDMLEDLRKQLFFAKALGAKIDRASRGLKTELALGSLWEQAQNMDHNDFDRLIAAQFQK